MERLGKTARSFAKSVLCSLTCLSPRFPGNMYTNVFIDIYRYVYIYIYVCIYIYTYTYLYVYSGSMIVAYGLDHSLTFGLEPDSRSGRSPWP